jgi:streptogramin lyase
VSQLRKALGRDRIVTQAPGYMVAVEPGALDSERFEQLVQEAHPSNADVAAEQLREALALWRGSPLADLDDSIARPERAELEDRRAMTLEQRIDADLELGRHEEVVSELEALVREDPLRERRRAQLMLALYRSGRQADALDTYRSGRKLLADELGLEPGDELRRLEKAILEQDPAIAAPAPPKRREPTPEERRRRLLGSPRLALVAGALLLAGAVIGIIIAVTSGSDPVVVEPNSVAVVNAKTGQILADVPIGGRPVAIARGAGAVWVVDGDHSTVSRIDEKTKERLSIGGLGGDISDLAFGFGSLWVAGGNDGTLARVDPRHNGIEEVDLGRTRDIVPQPVFAVRVGAGAVWLTRGNQVLRVDPRENLVTARRSVQRPEGIAVGLGALWVTTEDEHIVRIDTGTLKPVFSHDMSRTAIFPIVARGSLWVVAATGLPTGVPYVWRLDPGTLAQQAQIPFPDGFPYQLAAGSGAIWTVDPNDRALWRIDPRTSKAMLLARLPRYPIAVVAGDGVVWVGVQAGSLG